MWRHLIGDRCSAKIDVSQELGICIGVVPGCNQCLQRRTFFWGSFSPACLFPSQWLLWGAALRAGMPVLLARPPSWLMSSYLRYLGSEVCQTWADSGVVCQTVIGWRSVCLCSPCLCFGSHDNSFQATNISVLCTFNMLIRCVATLYLIGSITWKHSVIRATWKLSFDFVCIFFSFIECIIVFF